MKVIGINYSDTNYRRGFRMHAAVSLPLIPGHEGAGVVTAVGDGVSNVRAGDRVVFAGMHRFGTYREKMLVPAVSCVPVPADFDLKLATAVLNQGRPRTISAMTLIPSKPATACWCMRAPAASVPISCR